MNNKLEVIGIDHGWSMMKTIFQVFVTGVKEITTSPALFGDVLEYEGKFYKVGTVRQEVKDTKVEDDSFYLLTLAAVAKELKRRGLAEAKVFLAVGLPLTRFGAEKNDFIKYLTKNKRVSFKYENESYHIEIDDVAVFPQCYAAVVDKIPAMAKKTLIVDIGSWTIDIMPVINKSPDESKCVTIPKGLITCMRSINEQCVRQLNGEVDESEIQNIMRYGRSDIDDEYFAIIKAEIEDFVDKVYNSNHKVKQEVVKPESDWIRIEKNHEPIISDRDFEIVQRLLGMDTRISPDSDMVYNLSGIAVCADCGSPMTRKITTAGDKKYAYYICSNHKLTKQCSQHSISVSLLEDTVLEMLKLHIKNVMNLEEILDYIGTIPFQQLDVKSLEARKQKKLEEVEKCKRLKTSLYEDMKDGILTKEEYLELHEAYLKKAKEGEEIIRQIERDIALILEEKDDKHLWMNYFTEYKDIKELTRDVVVKLISEVRVSENKEVEIVFDFDDCYKQLLESVEKLGYQVDKEPGGQLNISRREAV